jgi:hypothetical protein
MNRLVIGALLCAVLAWSSACGIARAQESRIKGNPNIDIEYVEPKQAIYRPIYERLKKRRILEELREFLSPLQLRDKRIKIKIDTCGDAIDEMRPAVPATICYEYVHLIEQYAPKDKTALGISRADVIAGAFVLVSLHEVANAVFQVLDIPVWGRLHDAADKLAAFVMLEFGKNTTCCSKSLAWRTLTGTASFFEASKRSWTGTDFSDTDSPEQQRYYNFLCMAYGSDPDLFKDFVKPTLLKTRRAERCFREFDQVSEAWTQTIKKHVDPQLLEKVRQIEWVRPDDGILDK